MKLRSEIGKHLGSSGTSEAVVKAEAPVLFKFWKQAVVTVACGEVTSLVVFTVSDCSLS